MSSWIWAVVRLRPGEWIEAEVLAIRTIDAVVD